MKHSAVAAAGGAVSIALLLSLGGVAPAHAAESDADIPSVIERIAPEVLKNTTPASASQDVGVRVPRTPSEPITLAGLDSDNDSPLGITLPFAGEAERATPGAGGHPEFDNGNGTTTVPVTKSDGSVQITTVIEEPQAPQTYPYGVQVPEGASLKKLRDGSVSIEGPSGEFLGGFAAPWARTNDGKSVRTHYEIEGNKLVQVVDHQNLPDSAYPIVADPWGGRDLLREAWVDVKPNGSWVVNTNPSWWGKLHQGTHYHPAQLAELRGKLGREAWRVTPAVREQFFCHVSGAFFVWDTYNMESWRPYVPWSAQLNPQQQCNP